MLQFSFYDKIFMNPKKLSLEDRVKIQEYVYIRNRNNSFYTHCFPGALLEEVSTNGLDISRELFKDEYKILATCFETPYKTGELNSRRSFNLVCRTAI